MQAKNTNQTEAVKALTNGSKPRVKLENQRVISRNKIDNYLIDYNLFNSFVRKKKKKKMNGTVTLLLLYPRGPLGHLIFSRASGYYANKTSFF